MNVFSVQSRQPRVRGHRNQRHNRYALRSDDVIDGVAFSVVGCRQLVHAERDESELPQFCLRRHDQGLQEQGVE